MNFDEQLFDKIDKYLKGRLSPEETVAFEKEIAVDPKLAEMVDTQRFEEEGMEYLVEKDLIQKMKDWETNPPSDEAKKNDGNSNWKYGLGILLLLVVAAVYYFTRPPEPSAERESMDPTEESDVQPESPSDADDNIIQFDQQESEPSKKDRRKMADTEPEEIETITPDPTVDEAPRTDYLAMAETAYNNNLPANLRSAPKSTDEGIPQNVLTPGILAFTEGNMQLAISEFNKIDQAQNPEEYAQAQDYLAHAYFKTKQFNRASDIFKNIAENAKGNTAIDRAEWYWLLSLLPDYTANNEEVNRLLQKMTNPDNYHNYEAKAKELNTKLQNADN